MKTTKRTKLLSMFAALTIAAVPLCASFAASAATVTLPDNMKVVTDTNGDLVKGNLTVTLPAGVTGDYTVTAYEILQLIIPKDRTWTDGTPMTNLQSDDPAEKNIYVVTNEFKKFFADARTAYTAEGSTLPTTNDLYLTYDNATHKIQISDTAPADAVENEDYIKIDNAAFVKNTHLGRIEKTYFEADLVSRIFASPADATETTASAARLFSDWASKYIRDEALTADATAEVNAAGDTYEFKGDNALVYGYYAVITRDNSNDQNTPAVNQSILNVPMAENVQIKATAISIDKSVSNLLDENNHNNGTAGANDNTTRFDEDGNNKYDKMTANIGDVNHYVVESHIPSYTSFDLDQALADSKLLLNDESDKLTEENFETKTSGKYVYVFRDTMNFQDFLPVDITDTDKYGAAVDGVRVVIKATEGQNNQVTYFAKDFGTGDNHEYYLVLSNEAEKTDSIGRIWETDYNSTDAKDFFAINFDMRKLKALGLDGRDITISYNAELMGEALTSGADNTAKLRYSNDPFDADTVSKDTTTHKNEIFTYDLSLDKIFSDGATTDYYDDVTFKLFSDEAMEHAISFVQKKDNNNQIVKGSYVRADSNDENTTDTVAVSDADGSLLLHGLGEGTYYLVEQQDADLSNGGYNIVNPIRVVITAQNNDGTPYDEDNFKLFKNTGTDADPEYTTLSTATLDQVNLELGRVSDDYGVKFDVLNQKGFRLPLTGALGNWFIAIGGILLVAIGGTVIVLANRKKKDTKSEK